jgi:phosphoribosylaminoimidazole-succinocarboxamide synthase
MMITTGERLLQGKTKDVYAVVGEPYVLLQFRDDVRPFGDRAHAHVEGKGEWAASISASLFERLRDAGIPNHFCRKDGPARLLVDRLAMLPFFIVARNLAAGSLAKRFGMAEGTPLGSTIIEYYPREMTDVKQWLNESHIRAFGWATDEQMAQIQDLTSRVNEHLVPYLSEEKGLVLVDFRLEFGTKNGEVMLANELSPDNLRLWDMATSETLDGDRFRQGVDQVKDAYYEIYRRICLNE